MKTLFPILALLFFFVLPASAEQLGLFTYTVADGEITITNYPQDDTGPVEIPAEIDGLPVTIIGWDAFSGCTGLTSVSIPHSVTSIGWGAFSGCTGLTSVTIPEGVTTIRDFAFYGCSSLTSIEVDASNPNYSSLDGVLFNRHRTLLILYPAGKPGNYLIPNSATSIGSRGCDYDFSADFNGVFLDCFGTGAFEGSRELTGVSIPTGVTSIGAETFKGCSALTKVTIPAGVTFIGNEYSLEAPLAGAFEDCTSLHSAIFLGDAPTYFDGNSFTNTAPDFTIYYLSSNIGFTSPIWNGYPTVRIDESTYPAAPWLVTHGLPYDTELNQDLNGDGVSLLMAFALDLDPNGKLQSMMPTPVVNGSSLSFSFHAAAPGITFTVETSTDLQTWTTDGVVISDLDASNQRTASVPLDSPRRFLRLLVSEKP